MAISLSAIRQELKKLEEERTKIGTKIAALEQLKTAYKVERENGKGGQVIGRNVDLTPTIIAIFDKNDRKPMKKKEIAAALAKKLKGVTAEQIDQKLVYAVRPTTGILKKVGYGKYQLADDIDEGLQDGDPFVPDDYEPDEDDLERLREQRDGAEARE